MRSFSLFEPRDDIGSLYLLRHFDDCERVDNRAPGGWGGLFASVGRNNRRSAFLGSTQRKEKMMGFAHPRLLVINFSACFRFYRDMIGLKVTWGDENDSYASFANQEGKETVLALFARKAMAETVGADHLPTDAQAQDRVALIFHVDDIDAEADRIQARGIHLIAKPKDFPGWGIRSAYLRDPDGNLLELYSDLDREEWTAGLRDAAKKHGPVD